MPTAPAKLRFRRVRRQARLLKGRMRRRRQRLQRGFRADVANPQMPLSLDMSSDSRTLLIAFGGMKGELGIPPFEFFSATGGIPVKRLFVRDLRQAWYHEGIPGHGGSVSALADSLREIVEAEEVERLVVAGSSAGGYAALLFGTLLGADVVLSFGPQTVLELDVLADFDDHRWDGDLQRLTAAGTLDPSWTDLRAALPRVRSSDTRYELYFANIEGRHGRDRLHAERLIGLEGLHLYRFASRDHRIALVLREKGALDRVLRRALLSDRGLQLNNS
jgi:pimeloyl-ACP methyl ester carboxylesterase